MNRFLCLMFLVLAGLSLSGFSQTYTTRFEGTEDPLSEAGKWVNQGVDWTRIRKTNGIACGTQSGTNTGIYQYDDSYAHLSGFPPDQEAWGEVFIAKPQAPCIQEVEILLRWTSSPHRTTGYECFARCVSGGSSYVQIVRWEGPLGKFTYLADLRGTNYGLKSGDVLKASVIGNLIRVYINGVEKARATDNTHKTGNPGIGEFLYCDNRQGIGSNSDFGFSSFTARGLGGTSRAQTNAAGHTPLYVTPRSSLCSTTYCLAQTPPVGAEYLAYAPAGGPFAMDLPARFCLPLILAFPSKELAVSMDVPEGASEAASPDAASLAVAAGPVARGDGP